MSIKHSFVSAIADGGDDSLVRPSDWNDEHVVAYPLDNISGSPDSRDDDFDSGTTIDGKWTLYGNAVTTTEQNTNGYVSNLHLYRSDSGSKLSVYGQSLPSLPCTLYAKVSASTYRGNYQRGGGIILLPSSPNDSSAAVYFGTLYENGRQTEAVKYSNLSTYSSTVFSSGITMTRGWWLKVIINSSTSVDFYYSIDGYFWYTGSTAYNPGFTPAVAGVGFSPEGVSGIDAAFEYYKVR